MAALSTIFHWKRNYVQPSDFNVVTFDLFFAQAGPLCIETPLSLAKMWSFIDFVVVGFVAFLLFALFEQWTFVIKHAHIPGLMQLLIVISAHIYDNIYTLLG